MRQQTEPGSPKQTIALARAAQSRSTAQAESSYICDMDTHDMKLPLELWGEIIREAGTIQGSLKASPSSMAWEVRAQTGYI